MSAGKLGYLGPRGTFSEEAALLYRTGRNREIVDFPTISAVIEAISNKIVEEGIVPLENSLEGGVAATLDHLAGLEGIYIRHELICPIRQCLMSSGSTAPEEIRQILSHPHALGQCTVYLQRNFPDAEYLPVESTAAAAKIVKEKQGSAAVGPRRAAALFELQLLVEGIEDNPENSTRFVVLAAGDHPPTGRDKTSLVLTVADGPGKLYEALGFFARRGINLTRIESRPSRRIIGDWLFFIDCEGHRFDPGMESLWTELENAVPFFKLLGSYPIGSLQQ